MGLATAYNPVMWLGEAMAGSSLSIGEQVVLSSATESVARHLSTDIVLNCIQKFSACRAVNTLRLDYTNQSVNAV